MKSKIADEIKLVDLIEKFLDGIDDEMEHGCYSAPDCIPFEFEDEDDYYGNHTKIVDMNASTRSKIEKLIKKIRKNHDK